MAEQTATDIKLPVRYDKDLVDVVDMKGWSVVVRNGEYVAKCVNQHATLLARVTELEEKLAAAEGENERFNGLINVPHTADWLEAVPLEAAHQIGRWGTENDAGKDPTDWLWLIGYLVGKAVNSAKSGNIEKAKHHTISSGAVLLNWHRHLSGAENSFRPGIDGEHLEAKTNE